MATEGEEYAGLSAERVRELREAESISPERLREIAAEADTSVTAILEVEELRTPIVKALTRHDVEEHRDIYERLAES